MHSLSGDECVCECVRVCLFVWSAGDCLRPYELTMLKSDWNNNRMKMETNTKKISSESMARRKTCWAGGCDDNNGKAKRSKTENCKRTMHEEKDGVLYVPRNPFSFLS